MSELHELVEDINLRFRSISERFNSLENRQNIEEVVKENIYYIAGDKIRLVCAIKEFSLLGVDFFIHNADGGYALTDKLVGLRVGGIYPSMSEAIRQGKIKIHKMGIKKYLKVRNKCKIINPPTTKSTISK